MSRPFIGIIGNQTLLNDEYRWDGAGRMVLEAVRDVSGAIPVVVPGDADMAPLEAVLDRFDGFLLPGGRPNVHPEEYGEEETEAHGTFNRARDGLSLPLVRACVERGQPVLAICLGFQEMNVAMGGSLYPEIRDLPGRDNHRMPPDGTIEEKFALRHDVTLTEGGPFHGLMGSTVIRTNTLHGQGIKVAGSRVVIDGHAPDGTPEAIYIDGAPGFAMGVQWHPEYNAVADPVSNKLFSAFGAAARDWAGGKRPQQLRSA
ncbi:MAG: gamma-glutamyl-gamma-aminobutyrate hydrolase family protein [Rhodobacteraceae bacterium]|nr:gamma-glutamyl-gamma-aminobutyrate hydrolase family protein [Paracoccaceae bacterium]